MSTEKYDELRTASSMQSHSISRHVKYTGLLVQVLVLVLGTRAFVQLAYIQTLRSTLVIPNHLFRTKLPAIHSYERHHLEVPYDKCRDQEHNRMLFA